MKNKKIILPIISVAVVLLTLIGVTYAYWVLTKMQTNSNIISSACLDITIDNESAAISLGNQFPITDEEGMKLTPYTFTITNNCNTSVDYHINLESLGSEETAIKASSLKVALDNSSDLLSNKATIEPTISGAYSANRLGYGTLTAAGTEGSSVIHSLRIWMDYDAPISEANKTFQSKISVTIGQGIKNPYKEGTMAYDILANNDAATTLSAKFIGTNVKEHDSGMTASSTNWYGTEYTFSEETGKYTLSGELVQATLEECRNGTKDCGEYTLLGKLENTAYTYILKIISFTGVSADYGDTLYMRVQRMTAKNNFTITTEAGQGGLYKTIDDLGESYYFRGDVTNNYVQFGKYASDYKVYTLSNADVCWNSSCVYLTLESCQNSADYDYDSYDSDGNEVSCVETTSSDAGKDMYWRIVRINGDGTIRLVYDGTTKAENGTAHSATIGNSTYNREDYLNVNYGDSDIKGVVDTWYNTHLKTNYETSIADGIFCNDKEVTEAYYYDDEGNETTADNATMTDAYYAPYTRLYNKKAPRVTCTRFEDRYTTETSLGNGQLTYPVGLLTADETIFAGGLISETNRNYYLVNDGGFWTFTPYDAINSRDYARVCAVNGYGRVDGDVAANGEYGARPVINLRADIEFTGDGSFETPYVIKTN